MYRGSKTNGRRRGYSLAELILGAAVIAAFLVRVYISYSETHTSDEFTKLVSEISLIQGTARSQYTQVLSYQSVSAATISSVLPLSYVDQTSDPMTVLTPFHTPIGFTIVATDGNAQGGLGMDFSIPQAMCVRFIAGQNSLFDYVGVDSANGDGIPQANLQAPIGYDDALAACGTSATSKNVKLNMVFTGGDRIAD